MAGDAPPHAHYHKDLSHVREEEIWTRQERRAPLADLWWRLVDGRPGMRVLDVGCGPGFFTLDLARRVGPSGRVLALDVRPESVAFLLSRGPPPHVRALAWDVETAPPPETGFDLVLLTDVLHHAERPERLLASLRGVGKRLLVAEFDPDAPGDLGPPPDMRLARADVERMLRATGWAIERAEAHPFEHYAVLSRSP